ncbi:MAG: DASS family sodium-coupled anion symporter [Candidatus Diapherotrites archaeon]|nr:DASS family sodium-coupled anion symporter [Candidatus Diapherotrites archaeon]
MKKNAIFIISAFLMGAVISFIDFGLPTQAHSVFVVLSIAAVLWLSEALPLHITALLIPFLLTLTAGFTPKQSFSPFFDPVVVLLMGGFVLAYALQKYHLDEEIAYYFVNKIGTSPRRFLFGIMLVSAFLSMWMSNTATTAVMLPIALVVLRKSGLKPLKSRYGKAVVLGVAYAATIGGISTIVGTTPNAMAVKFLADEGINITFDGWMYHALPLVLIMLPMTWLILLLLNKPETKQLSIKKHAMHISNQQKQVLFVFALTAFLWLTTGIHGVPSSLVALMPIFLFSVFSLMNTEDFGKIHWDILILIGGGLSLGSAMEASKLNIAIADVMSNYISSHHPLLILFIVSVFCIIMSMFASNTGTAAFVIPIVIPLASTLGIGIKQLVLLSAIAVSLNFILPVGTPPNAIAYSSRYVTVKDMVKSGIIISLIGAVVITVLSWLYW